MQGDACLAAGTVVSGEVTQQPPSNGAEDRGQPPPSDTTKASMSSSVDVEDDGGGVGTDDDDLPAGVCGCEPTISVSLSVSLRAVQISGPAELYMLGLLICPFCLFS